MGDGSCESLIDDESLLQLHEDEQYVGEYLGLYNNELEIYAGDSKQRPMLSYVEI